MKRLPPLTYLTQLDRGKALAILIEHETAIVRWLANSEYIEYDFRDPSYHRRLLRDKLKRIARIREKLV